MSTEALYQKLSQFPLPFGGDKFGGREESLLYVLELIRLEFKQLSHGNNYVLNLCFFDFQTRRFGGSHWTQNCTARNSKIQIDQRLFFRTLSSKNAVIIVAELGERQLSSDGSGIVAICWTAIPLGGISEQIENVSSSTAQEQLRRSFPLYAGSCRVLLLGTGLNQLEPHLRSFDSTLVLALRLSPTPIDQPMPHFHFLSQSQFGSPEAAPKFTALLDNFRLSYSDGGKKLGETFLLDLLAREYCYAANRQWKPADGLQVLERRLKIGAHNGMEFFEEPVCLLLEPLPNSASASLSTSTAATTLFPPQRSRSWGRLEDARGQIGADGFGVRQSVRLRSLPFRPELAILFQLDYLIGYPISPDLLANARLIRVARASWSPCNDSGEVHPADTTVSLQLVGGPPAVPFGGAHCLPSIGNGHWPPPHQRLRINLRLNFVPLPEGDDGLTPTKGLPRPRARPNFPQSPLPHLDRQKQAQTPPSEPTAPSAASPHECAEVEREKEGDEAGATMRLLWPTALSSQPLLATIQPQPNVASTVGTICVELPAGRVHPLPRSMIGLMAKFPPIHAGNNGPMPKAVDVQNGQRELDMAMEATERRWPGSELSIQFLAFLPLQNAAFPRITRQPPRLFFSFQFYRFEQIVTECLFAESSNEGDTPQPMLLWREGALQPGLTTRFVVGADQQADFASYLLGHQLHLHIWEAHSLFHLGTVSIPLKFLLRQGSPAVQCSLQCPVFQAGFPPVWCPSQQGPCLNGLLFLRLANVGLSYAYPGIAALKPTQKRRVPALRNGQQSPLERFFALQRLDLDQRSARLFGSEEAGRVREWTQLNAEKGHGGGTIMASGNAQKFLFAEELAAYRALRREGKAMALLRAVFSSITTHLNLDLTLGQLHLFSFQLRNPLAEDLICEMEANDPRLSPIFAPEELKYLRRHQHQGGISGLEETLWQQPKGQIGRPTAPTAGWRLGLRAMEELDLGMRFEPGMDGRECCEKKECRLFVRRMPSGHPLVILELTLQIRPPFLAQHLRWFAEESRKLVRCVQSKKGAQFLRCSDPTVHCQLQENGRLVGIECQTGESPHVRDFLLFLYDSPHLPVQVHAVWRISIHSLGRLHSETVQGQPVRVPLPMPASLAGTLDELICLHCSSPSPSPCPASSIHFHPGPTFPAAAHSGAIQPTLLITIQQMGNFHLLVNAVRASSQQPIGQWLLSVVVGKPNVTKVFQVIVPSQVQHQTVHKRIPLDNPLAIARQFRLSSSDPGLLSVPMPSPSPIPANSSIPIQLDIHPPASRPAQCQALLFVQDAETRSQEEAFQLNIRFH